MLKVEMDQLTRQGIDAVRLGNIPAGEGLLQQAVQRNPHNALAWHWLASIAPNEMEKRRRLRRVLEIDPTHAFALRDLAALDGNEGQAPRETFGRPKPAAPNPITTTLPAPKKTAADTRFAAPSSTTAIPTAPATAIGAAPVSLTARPKPDLTPATVRPNPATSTTTGTGAATSQPVLDRGTPKPGAGLGPATIGATIGAAAVMAPSVVRAPTSSLGGTAAQPAAGAPGITSVISTSATPSVSSPAAPPTPAAAPSSTTRAQSVQSPTPPAAPATLGQTGALGVGGHANTSGPGVRTAGAPPTVLSEDAGLLRNLMTAGDAVAISRQPAPVTGSTATTATVDRAGERLADERYRMMMLVAAGIFCAALIGALVSRHMLQTQARTRAGMDAAATSVAGEVAPGVLSDRVGAPLDALSPDAPSSRVPTSNGVVNVPGTGFLNGAGRQNIAEQAGDVIHLWREPFNRHGAPACSLPHASGVLVLESQTGSAGSNAFKVENRGCVGWVDGSDLSATRPEPLGPSSNTKGEEPPK